MQKFNTVRGAMGIYAIIHCASGRAYIGSSANVGERWYSHRGQLRRSAHKNHVLQAAWNELGEGEFRFLLLERVDDIEQVRPREQAWLDQSEAWKPDRGFNRSCTTHGAGWRYTAAQRAALAAALTGRVRSPEHQAALTASRRRRGVTQADREHMARVGRSGRGVPKSPEHRAKIGAAQRGSTNHRALVTETQVRDIKRRLADGEKGCHLAREFGISEVTVSNIKSGRRWRHIT